MRPGAVLCAALIAVQSGVLPLPSNYKTTMENADVLVMKVHYGAHEFVPMHDHSAYPTVYLYLNDSGEVQLKHQGEDGFVATRPPTHRGAWRISPGVAERHSVQSLSDTASDFLRIELKGIPTNAVEKVSRGEAPASTFAGTRVEMKSDALEINRAVCPADTPCTMQADGHRALLAAVVSTRVEVSGRAYELQAGDVLWVPEPHGTVELSSGGHILRVSLLYAPGKRTT
jgi:hypothetical protein